MHIPTTARDGLVALGYVGVSDGDRWTSVDGRSWQLTQLDRADPSFATGVAAGTGGRIVAVGRPTERLLVAVGSNGAPDTRIPTAWLSPVPGR
jgi:hypothetical protein